ncbi:MAG: transcription termination/antitermination NusG family protein [Anaerolineales bacterium]
MAEEPKPNTARPQAGQHWYVIRSKPRRERFVYEQLNGQGLEVFYPSVRVHPVNPRSSKERAYFPSYLFTHLDLAAVGINKLRWLPAAVGLLEFGGEPAIVLDALIAKLKLRVASIQSVGGVTFDGLQTGDVVKITSGPFAGYEAIFDLRLKGSERVRVLLEMLRRQVTVEIDAGSIRKARASELDKPARRSR